MTVGHLTLLIMPMHITPHAQQLGMAKTNSSGPGTSAFAAGAHSGGLGGSGSALGQQGLSPQAMQQQLSDLASQHRAAMLQAKACFTQVQVRRGGYETHRRH